MATVTGTKIETKTETVTNYPYTRTIGVDNIIAYTKHASSITKTFVSVGSGTGVIEYKLQQEIPDIKITCIDPTPESRNEYPSDGKYIKPHYPSIKKAIKENKDLFGCGLLLIWPEPISSASKSDLIYDLEAIIKLNPKVIIIVHEVYGASGSASLRFWMRTFREIPFSDLQLRCGEHELEFDVPSISYDLHYQYDYSYSNGFDTSRDEICLITRRDVKLEKSEKLKTGSAKENNTTKKNRGGAANDLVKMLELLLKMAGE